MKAFGVCVCKWRDGWIEREMERERGMGCREGGRKGGKYFNLI